MRLASEKVVLPAMSYGCRMIVSRCAARNVPKSKLGALILEVVVVFLSLFRLWMALQFVSIFLSWTVWRYQAHRRDRLSSCDVIKRLDHQLVVRT